MLAEAPWVELASEMSHLTRFAESAGFVRIGVGGDQLRTASGRLRDARASQVGGAWSCQNCTPSARASLARRTRFSRPVCYLFDNRPNRKAATDEQR
jgi:hypothetical protein